MLDGIKKEEISLKGMDYLELLQLRLRINEATAQHEAKAMALLNAGQRAPGFRLKKGRKSRSIGNPATLVMAVTEGLHIDRDALFTEKMIGIPAIETLLLGRGMTKDKVALFLHDHVTTKFSDASLEFVGA